MVIDIKDALIIVVKMTFIICVTAALIASMGYGYFDEIVGIFK